MMLEGRVLDQFTATPVMGVRVTFRNQSALTDGDGYFAIPGTASTRLRPVKFVGPTIVSRTAYAKSGSGTWKVLPAGFDVTEYDTVARGWDDTTVRWKANPVVYVDARPHGFNPSAEVMATFIAEGESYAREFVAAWSDGLFYPTVTVTSSPPADFTAGTLVLRFSELAADYGASGAIGYARVRADAMNFLTGATVAARAWQYRDRPLKRKGIIAHEVGHAMGMAHATKTSLMQPSLGSKTDLLAWDRLAAKALYGRYPQNAWVDVDARVSGGAILLARARDLFGQRERHMPDCTP